ncbi:hypothetical protein RF11_12793 [Thelohanellus kitauei]|uniref:Uncharacterized protein n=1 Tax=Thelohanellus kitauei TaxID=669202 RepID=A0A0C2MAL8_THEKT|nr:hypothetical protein RF11_12793 [Thelohanellus kitauei]
MTVHLKEESCSDKFTNLRPQFHSLYAVRKNQKISSTALFFLFIIVTVVLIGLTNYLRHNIKRNTEIDLKIKATVCWIIDSIDGSGYMILTPEYDLSNIL